MVLLKSKITFSVLLLITLLVPLGTSKVANAEEPVDMIDYYIYDENDELVDVITEPAPEKSDFTVQLSYYDFSARFSSNIWIRNGSTFRNPDQISTEVSGRPAGPWGVRIYNSRNEYQGRMEVRDRGNWIVFPVRQLAPRGYSYKFQFYNNGPGTIIIDSGILTYNR